MVPLTSLGRARLGLGLGLELGLLVQNKLTKHALYQLEVSTWNL